MRRCEININYAPPCDDAPLSWHQTHCAAACRKGIEVGAGVPVDAAILGVAVPLLEPLPNKLSAAQHDHVAPPE